LRESKIKSDCTKLLLKKGYHVVHLITTNKPGIPDTMVLKDGKVFFIEFKQPGKKLRALQEYQYLLLVKHGFTVLIVDNINMLNDL